MPNNTNTKTEARAEAKSEDKSEARAEVKSEAKSEVDPGLDNWPGRTKIINKMPGQALGSYRGKASRILLLIWSYPAWHRWGPDG